MGKRVSSPTQIDLHVGAKIRERRVAYGLTQQQLADMIGVTYQQAHKYEKGINRVSAGRLFQIATYLKVGVMYFYEGLDDNGVSMRTEPENERMMLEISRNFAAIKDQRHREVVATVARVLAN